MYLQKKYGEGVFEIYIKSYDQKKNLVWLIVAGRHVALTPDGYADHTRAIDAIEEDFGYDFEIELGDSATGVVGWWKSVLVGLDQEFRAKNGRRRS